MKILYFQEYFLLFFKKSKYFSGLDNLPAFYLILNSFIKNSSLFSSSGLE